MFFRSSGLTCEDGWLASRINVDGGWANATAPAITTTASKIVCVANNQLRFTAIASTSCAHSLALRLCFEGARLQPCRKCKLTVVIPRGFQPTGNLLLLPARCRRGRTLFRRRRLLHHFARRQSSRFHRQPALLDQLHRLANRKMHRSALIQEWLR